MRYDRYWNEKYQIVKEYLDAHSGELPHKDLVYKGIKIRYWLYNQRRLLKREMTKESQERLKLLSELNSPISFEPNEKQLKLPLFSRNKKFTSRTGINDMMNYCHISMRTAKSLTAENILHCICG